MGQQRRAAAAAAAAAAEVRRPSAGIHAGNTRAIQAMGAVGKGKPCSAVQWLDMWAPHLLAVGGLLPLDLLPILLLLLRAHPAARRPCCGVLCGAAAGARQ